MLASLFGLHFLGNVKQALIHPVVHVERYRETLLFRSLAGSLDAAFDCGVVGFINAAAAAADSAAAAAAAAAVAVANAATAAVDTAAAAASPGHFDANTSTRRTNVRRIVLGDGSTLTFLELDLEEWGNVK